jgi:acyl-CoA thioesterase
MTKRVHDELVRRAEEEPYGRLLGMKVVSVGPGCATVTMTADGKLRNVFGATHGGALFSLIDEAFQLACNTHGVLAVALNVSITYVASPGESAVLEATAEEVHRTNRTASYLCGVREKESGRLIATAQALAYRTGKEVL